jgi:hypothetical protein
LVLDEFGVKILGDEVDKGTSDVVDGVSGGESG